MGYQHSVRLQHLSQMKSEMFLPAIIFLIGNIRGYIRDQWCDLQTDGGPFFMRQLSRTLRCLLTLAVSWTSLCLFPGQLDPVDRHRAADGRRFRRAAVVVDVDVVVDDVIVGVQRDSRLHRLRVGSRLRRTSSEKRCFRSFELPVEGRAHDDVTFVFKQPILVQLTSGACY